MGFGQGALLVTPLQMALIGATIANGGSEPRPYVVRQVVRDGVAASVSATGTLANPVSRDTAAKVTKMMIAVVERGTGTPAQLHGVQRRRKDRHGDQSAGTVARLVRRFAPRGSPARRRRRRRRERRLRRDVRRADRARRAADCAGEPRKLRPLIEERIFNNRYRLDRKLGEGGMATVYCGTDILLRRRVAIKVLREQYAADEEFVRRFYQEAESAARLSHPNIVNTFDVGRQDDTYFIVMELVDGATLGEIIAADGTLPEPVAIDYAAQIASGLAYAHRQGLLHRDIKPANILVTKDDVVKLSDFGIARAVSQQTMALTKPGLVMGSVYYISPEQAQEHEVHETSDLYSLGVVLYQMLTGKLPYTGESPVTVALKHIGDPVPTIDVRAAGISPALAAIVNRLLQKHPQNRFQSASELATALREARERPSVAAFRIADDAPWDIPPHRARCRRGARRCPTVPTTATMANAPAAALGRFRAGHRALGRDRPRISDLRAPALRRSRRHRRRRLHWSDASAGAAGRRECRSAHAIHQERERDGAARSRDPAIAARRDQGRAEPSRRARRQQRQAAARTATTCGASASNDAQRALQQDGFAVTLRRRYDNTDSRQRDRPNAQARRQGSRAAAALRWSSPTARRPCSFPTSSA